MTTKTPEEILLGLGRDRFADIVDRDLRRRNKPDGYSPQEMALFVALRSPEVCERWYNALLRTSRSTEGQLASREVEYNAQKARLIKQVLVAKQKLRKARITSEMGDYAGEEAQDELDRLEIELQELKSTHLDRKSKMLRFKTGLDEWLTEARDLVVKHTGSVYESVVTAERNHYAQRVRELEDAILLHEHSFDDEDEPSEADFTLWSRVGDRDDDD